MAEIEAKFLLRRPEQLDDVVGVLRTYGYEVERDGTSTHVDRYFDTADWAILRAGWAYRCRSRGEDSKLTLKSLGSGDGHVFVREEIDQPLPKKKACHQGELPSGPVQRRISKIAGAAHCDELFSVESRRTVYFVRVPGDRPAQIELDFDETTIRAEKRSRKAPGRLEFAELELELATGDADAGPFSWRLSG